ncbi:MAG: LCP family protein [Vulcanimicrobiaceae bacterium]
MPKQAWRRIPALVGIGVLSIIVGFAAVIAGMSIVEHRNPFDVVADAFIPTPQQLFGVGQLRVLVVGLDYDYTANDQPFSSYSRSDVIMAVNMDFTTKQLYELSIPRDMVATLPDGTQAKINQAMADGGITEAESVVAQWLGIPGFDRYVVLRINATKDLIDAIGGVEVDVKNSNCLVSPHHCVNGPINYDDNWGHLHVHLQPGLQHLDGAQAVGYARFRHDWCSDPCRIMRQQQVLHAIAAKLQGNRLNTLLHFNSLISVFRHDVSTNFSNEELLSLAAYFSQIGPKDVHTAQVPYVANVYLPGYGDSIVPNETAKAKLVSSMLIAPPTPRPSPDPAFAAVAPSTVRVDVENAGGIADLAHDVAARLRKRGFRIVAVGNAAAGNATTTVIYVHSAIPFAGQLVRKALPSRLQAVPVIEDTAPSSIGATSPVRSDVTVIVGSDAVPDASRKR